MASWRGAPPFGAVSRGAKVPALAAHSTSPKFDGSTQVGWLRTAGRSMNVARNAMEETITLKQAKKLVQCMADEQSFLLLSPPGVGKSEMVYQAAKEVGIPCRSLLGTQIAPEDVSGIPRIIGERSVFCPPRAAAAGKSRTVLPVPRRTAGLRARRAEGVLLAAAGAAARRARAAGRHLGHRRGQPPAGSRAGALDEFGAGQPRHHHASAGRCRRVAGVGGAPRDPRRHPQFHFLHARGADASGAGRAGAVLDAARLGAALPCARPGAKPPAS